MRLLFDLFASSDCIGHAVADLLVVMMVYQRLGLKLKLVHLVAPLFIGDSFLNMEVVNFVAIEAEIVVLDHQKRWLDLLSRNNEFALF